MAVHSARRAIAAAAAIVEGYGAKAQEENTVEDFHSCCSHLQTNPYSEYSHSHSTTTPIHVPQSDSAHQTENSASVSKIPVHLWS